MVIQSFTTREEVATVIGHGVSVIPEHGARFPCTREAAKDSE